MPGLAEVEHDARNNRMRGLEGSVGHGFRLAAGLPPGVFDLAPQGALPGS